MVGKYLGEFDKKVITPTIPERQQWVLDYITSYGGIDGSHHKDWVLDQCVRIILGNSIETCTAKWDCGEENFRFNLTNPPTEAYNKFIEEYKNGEDGPDTYGYDIGIPP